jgi:tetraacyldisaccharide 4'-kinase
MKFINWADIHESKRRGALWFFLKLLSIPYGLAVKVRLYVYNMGLIKIRSLPAYVVSVGNITVGGTGKTPFVAMLAGWAAENGFRAAILSRGYGGKRNSGVIVVSDGTNIMASVDDAGDEPILLARKLSTVPVLISKKRYLAGDLASERFGAELMLLDDGYQHLSVHRKLNILLLDAKRRFGNGSLLPLGPLREPLEQMERADLVVITKCNDEHRGNELVDFVQRRFPGKPIFRAGHFPDRVMFPRVGKEHPLDFLAEKRVVAFAGVAQPRDFLDTVKSLKADVIHFEAFSDHHRFKQAEIAALVSEKKHLGGDLLLTTEKDWVRIDGRIDVGDGIAVLAIRTGLLSDSDLFFDMIKQGIKRSRESFGNHGI